MRICHVVRQFHPSVGGLENFVAMLARNQSELDCACEVLTLDRVFLGRQHLPASERVQGLQVRRVPMLGHRRFFLPIITQRMLDNYDVIHVHGIDGMFDRLARQRRRPKQVLVATSHGAFFHTKWLSPLKRAYFASVTRLAARRYDVLLANSSADQRLLRTLHEDVVLTPNGVLPIGAFRAQGRDLLFVGRLSAHKHVERLISALAQPCLQGVRLHVIGPQWDVDPLRLARQAEAAGLAERVLLHGHVDARKLADIARSCGVFVSASTYEGFGMSLIEAMSVGLLPVVEANASFLELVEAAGVGALTDFTRPDIAAGAIRQQLDCLNEAQQKQAVQFASRFSWKAHAENTIAVYRNARQRQRPMPAAPVYG